MAVTRAHRSVRVRGVAVGGVVAAVVLLAAGCAGAEDDEHPDRKSFALQGRTLTVDSDDSALELVAADVKEVRVTRWFSGEVVVGDDPKVTWKVDGDRLVLRKKCSGMIANCSLKHRIEVPRGIAVKVENGDGSVTARGFRTAVDVHSGDGSVRVTESSGPLNLRTDDGSVRVDEASGPLTLRTGDGSIRASGIEARRVKASTGDGSVHLELGVVPDLVESQTKDGSISIALPRDAQGSAKGSGEVSYRVSAESNDGSVDVSVPRADDSPHVVSARTGDGKITVKSAN
ncbi:DUF4097 family beta strand repeat-containing protein [Streptomyces cavernae]|uniref:DUF4097 family beta strand repeat-containing protein n=1 Tax=Streptomyces cavernae TaxID=2259034 RepID=UPI000FEBB257|nr:DUF4097 family beta strand repeat-containing protein [Streptomyces cavernae]